MHTDIGLPNGLTFDPFSKLLCWADAGNVPKDGSGNVPKDGSGNVTLSLEGKSWMFTVGSSVVPAEVQVGF